MSSGKRYVWTPHPVRLPVSHGRPQPDRIHEAIPAAQFPQTKGCHVHGWITRSQAKGIRGAREKEEKEEEEKKEVDETQ